MKLIPMLLAHGKIINPFLITYFNIDGSSHPEATNDKYIFMDDKDKLEHTRLIKRIVITQFKARFNKYNDDLKTTWIEQINEEVFNLFHKTIEKDTNEKVEYLLNIEKLYHIDSILPIILEANDDILIQIPWISRKRWGPEDEIILPMFEYVCYGAILL